MTIPELHSLYLEKITSDIAEDLQFFSQYIGTTFPKKKKIKKDISHKDKLFEWTTHPSQTWDTLVRQLRREAKQELRDIFEQHRKEKKFLKEEWNKNFGEEFCKKKAEEIIYDCKKRLFSLQNAKIPAHADMTPALLQKVPKFFEVYDRYKMLSGWKQEEKAEEKNISFLSFLDEQPTSPVLLDERREAVETAKRILEAGEEKYYLWIDFDGAKRPDGIMLSIFAQMLIEDINESAHGISEQNFVEHNSFFTLSEREKNRKIVNKFNRIDKGIYTLTRQMASEKKYTQNPVCIMQMELFKAERSRYLRKLVKMRDEAKQRREEKKFPEMKYLSECVHFIPRFDPEFVRVVQKSNFGENLESLEGSEVQDFNTVSHIIDQILVINNLSEERVCQIILAQTQNAEDILTVDKFLEQKSKQWRAKKSQYFAPDPTEKISICPLFEEEKTTTPHHIENVLEKLWKEITEKKGQKYFETKIIEFFFAGSDLSKNIGSSSAYIATWKAAEKILAFNKKYSVDIRVKLGSGESYFRQNGFLDPQFGKSLWEKKRREEAKNVLQTSFGVSEIPSTKTPSGLFSLLKKSSWLNSITLQSKAREWIFEMSPFHLSSLISKIREEREKNRKFLLSGKTEILPHELEVFADAEKKFYQSIIYPQKNKGKPIISFPSLVEFFATQMTPVLRDRALQRESGTKKKSIETLLQKISSNSGISSRAIAANTASSFLFPLGLLGKGSAFETVEKKFSREIAQKALSFWEPEELLQMIRHYSLVAESVFTVLKKNGFQNIEQELSEEWKKILHFVPDLQNIVWKKYFPQHNFSQKEKNKILPLLNEKSRALLDIRLQNREIVWNFFPKNLQGMQWNWELSGKKVVEDICTLLSKKPKKDLLEENISEWDTFMTISCRLRGDRGLLG